MGRENLTEKGTFEQRSEGGKGVDHADSWRKNILGRENSKCRGPEVDMPGASEEYLGSSVSEKESRGFEVGEVRGETNSVILLR